MKESNTKKESNRKKESITYNCLKRNKFRNSFIIDIFVYLRSHFGSSIIWDLDH